MDHGITIYLNISILPLAVQLLPQHVSECGDPVKLPKQPLRLRAQLPRSDVKPLFDADLIIFNV